ncbi:hypothetical protein Tco_0399824, partial [Tanacetum coccineum]
MRCASGGLLQGAVRERTIRLKTI